MYAQRHQDLTADSSRRSAFPRVTSSEDPQPHTDPSSGDNLQLVTSPRPLFREPTLMMASLACSPPPRSTSGSLSEPAGLAPSVVDEDHSSHLQSARQLGGPRGQPSTSSCRRQPQLGHPGSEPARASRPPGWRVAASCLVHSDPVIRPSCIVPPTGGVRSFISSRRRNAPAYFRSSPTSLTIRIGPTSVDHQCGLHLQTAGPDPRSAGLSALGRQSSESVASED